MRTYAQFCGLARALDHVGDRWTLLIVRELLIGPRRFTDLRANLPGLATNLLADRLRRLADDGLILRRELPPPAPATVYELSDDGRALEPVILDLISFGARYMTEPAADEAFRPEWLALAIRALLPATPPFTLTAQLHAGDLPLVLRAADTVRVEPGETADPDVTVRGDARTLLGLFAGRQPLAAVHVSGDRRALKQLLATRAPARFLERVPEQGCDPWPRTYRSGSRPGVPR